MNIEKEFEKLANKEKAKILSRYFKTGKGEYGEGDIFLGIPVPLQRKLVKEKLRYLDLESILKLLKSEIHEHRMSALMALVEKYQKGEKEQIFNYYLDNTKYINSWDLVDLSAPRIVGDFLSNKDKSILYKLAKSTSLWERRISIVSTYAFIKKRDFLPTLEISKILLEDKEDLIKKAVGWMLREVGKRDKNLLIEFLKENINNISSTTLSYSLEKFSKEEKEIIRNSKTK